MEKTQQDDVCRNMRKWIVEKTEIFEYNHSSLEATSAKRTENLSPQGLESKPATPQTLDNKPVTDSKLDFFLPGFIKKQTSTSPNSLNLDLSQNTAPLNTTANQSNQQEPNNDTPSRPRAPPLESSSESSSSLHQSFLWMDHKICQRPPNLLLF